MYYYFDTVFLFMAVMPAGSIVSAISLEKKERKIYMDVYLCLTSVNNSGQCPMCNLYTTITGSSTPVSFAGPQVNYIEYILISIILEKLFDCAD